MQGLSVLGYHADKQKCWLYILISRANVPFIEIWKRECTTVFLVVCNQNSRPWLDLHLHPCPPSQTMRLVFACRVSLTTRILQRSIWLLGLTVTMMVNPGFFHLLGQYVPNLFNYLTMPCWFDIGRECDPQEIRLLRIPCSTWQSLAAGRCKETCFWQCCQ